MTLLQETTKATSVISNQTSQPHKKTRGTYMNWYQLDLWPPIHAAVKQHKNLGAALHYIQVTHRKLGVSESPYDKLSRGSLYKWFTTKSELKEK